MELDLTPVINNPKAAVHCPTYEQAKLFVRCVMARDWRRCGENMIDNWNNYKEETCYSPYFEHPVKNYMTYCPVSHYVREGFDIIEFAELSAIKELETELGGESLDFLLGI